MDLLNAVFAHSVAFAAIAVVVVHQFLKLKFIPVTLANRYPVPTVILLSTGAAILVVLNTAVTPHTWIDWIILVGTITVTAALTYNATIHNWTQLRAIEG